jgi:ubiquitin C-terminal hydrolase
MKNMEDLEDYTCDKCNTRLKNVHRVYTLKMLPEIVVIIFNKYGRKINCYYPSSLSFPAKNMNKKTIDYKLVAQIDHSGSMSGGHYVAKGVRGKEVFLFNDSSVSQSELGPTNGAFMVFYSV